ncbi:MAG: hypothetical protein EOM76_04080 [Sphingobacteriia bacterium]|nr:hypothetical protein [Sphingobacteriia bacterium]
MDGTIVLADLTVDAIRDFTEKQAAELVNLVEVEPDREIRTSAIRVINNVFDLRSVSVKSKGMQNDLGYCGYLFFPIANNAAFVRGVRKRSKKS